MSKVNIGRDKANDIVINDSKVSRKHLEIKYENGHFSLKDLGSTNGTFVNGKKIDTETEIFIGDNVKIGDIVLPWEKYFPKKQFKSSLLIEKNGEPQILKHDCPPERVGKEMTREERHRFAVELLAELYEKSGMTMVNVNHNYHREFPNLVMKSKNGKLYYVIIETACFPKRAESITKASFSEMKQYAKEFNATPAFAGMSFLNINRDMNNCKMICGDSYVVSFNGLLAI